jgi:gamma-glutamylcyclotransferase (GGCT)/AIG2-like uncharacterized protein YtfP
MPRKTPTPESCRLLFAYGTLMSGAVGSKGRAQRDRLARVADVVGQATVTGRLYNLGQYPGLKPVGGAGEVVHGEVLELASPHGRSLRWLDSYEGIVPGNHPHNEYERRIVDATLDDGAVVQAWTYICLLQPTPWAWIASGSWLDR